MKKIKEYSIVYLVGSVGYSAIEILWRGFTHWSMALTGGFCMVLLYRDNLKDRHRSLWKKCARGSAIITTVELTVGCIVNLILKLNVWDYSKIPFNVLGQICPLYSILWFFLCIPITSLNTVLQRQMRPNRLSLLFQHR